MTTVNLKDRSTYYASDDLLNQLKSKLATLNSEDVILNFAYTDYGGDFFDKVMIQYFTEKYPDNIVSELTVWNGENAFVFGSVATEFYQKSESYFLGFEDVEEFYYSKLNEEEEKGFNDFLEDLKKYQEYQVKPEALEYLLNEKSGYYSVLTTGLDFNWNDLTEELEGKGLIEKVED